MKFLKSDANPESDLGVVYSDKKIGILEKLMASNSAESEILRKYYFSKISKPKNRTAQLKSLGSFQS